MKNIIRIVASATLLLAAATAPALAQQFPTKPIRIIVPAPAAGPFDRIMRPLAQEMAVVLKQPVVVENRPSAGNIVGTQAGAAAAPDGYTLTMTGMLNTIAAGMYDKVPFDIVSDFAHVGVIGGGAQWLVVRGDAGIHTFQELVAQARREPGKVNYASSGLGSTGHLVMEQLQRATGTTMTHVPYKGGAPALQDVLSGVVSVLVIPPNAAMQHVKADKLKVLAVSSATRMASVPEVTTFAELGLRQLTVSSWVGLSAPKGTPQAVVARIHAALEQALANPALKAQLVAEGMEPMQGTPQQYTQLVKSDTERWGQLTRSLNIKAN
ncbi:MAG TPA: tripartite tricarboxylate transporter substrate binding protein [Ramlibacter sp.]|jgi:tripartite-type tricarboxylate transporter receptor subunit TctC